METTSFIDANYVIVFKPSQLEKVDDAKVFVIGERHPGIDDSPFENECVQTAAKINAQLIEKYAVNGSVFFIETMRGEVENVEQTLCERFISQGMKDTTISSLTSEMINNALKNVTLLKLFPFLDKTVPDRISWISGWDLPRDHIVDQETADALTSLGKTVGLDVDGTFASLHAVNQKIDLEQKRATLGKRLIDIEKKFFPARTESMAGYIYNAAQVPSIQKIFVQAGLGHLIQGLAPDHSLMLFYQVLEACKGVALVPKNLWSMLIAQIADQKERAVKSMTDLIEKGYCIILHADGKDLHIDQQSNEQRISPLTKVKYIVVEDPRLLEGKDALTELFRRKGYECLPADEDFRKMHFSSACELIPLQFV